jgi:hypothetical protein
MPVAMTMPKFDGDMADKPGLERASKGMAVVLGKFFRVSVGSISASSLAARFQMNLAHSSPHAPQMLIPWGLQGLPAQPAWHYGLK